MTKFRVGVGGATVFDEDGNAIGELQPGAVIVPGSLKVPGSLADQHLKGLRGYSDKMLRPYEDKAQ